MKINVPKANYNGCVGISISLLSMLYIEMSNKPIEQKIIKAKILIDRTIRKEDGSPLLSGLCKCIYKYMRIVLKNEKNNLC